MKPRLGIYIHIPFCASKCGYCDFYSMQGCDYLMPDYQDALGDSVSAVRFSRKLASQPCCLTTEGGITLEMEKYFRHGPNAEMRKLRATRVLELNPDHRVFAAIKAAYESDKDKAKSLSVLVCRMAEMLSGVEIEDPTAFVSGIAELF